jgi:hypothetical protein
MATENIAAKLLSDLKRDFGLTDEQAAGVVGNLMHESGGFNSLQEVNPSSGRGGFGYAQWTGPRRTAFENYATQNNLEPTSYEANYGYLKHELANDPYERRQFNTVKNAKTASEAARLVSENFLRPGTPNLTARQNYANQALGYANSPVPPMDVPMGEVGTALDVRRVAPNPSSQAPLMASSRAVTSPSGGNSDLSTALQAYARREGNRVVPASVEDRVTARNRAPLMASSVFGDDPGTPASGPVVATIPSQPSRPSSADAARRAVLSIGGNQTFAGQERMPALSGGVGQPPATRVVPTTTVTPRQTAAQSIANARNEQMATRQPTPQGNPLLTPSAPALTQEQRLALLSTAQPDDRLPSTPMVGARAAAPAMQAGPYWGATVLPTVTTAGLTDTAPIRPSQPLMAASAPMPASVAQRDIARNSIMNASPPMSAQLARMAPIMAASRQPLSIVVDGANMIQPSQQSAVNQIRNEGYTAAQAYDLANERASERALAGATSGHSVSGGLRYDPDSAGWVRA